MGFTYQNAHQALHGLAWYYADALRAQGYTVDVFNLAGSDTISWLIAQLNEDQIAFCFGPQGVGSRLGNDEQTLWKRTGVPFIGLHGDNPCYNIFNHFGDTPRIANLYLYKSFAAINRRYLNTHQIVDTLPFQTGDMGPSPIPFRERPIKLLFLKSGESVDECVQKLDSLPQPLRDGVWEQIERAKNFANFVVCDLVQELFDHCGLVRAEHFDLFWGCAHWMDMYLRRKRAADFVAWLAMQDGAVIIGSGWDFIDTSKARAVFKPSVPIHQAIDFYRQSQIVCNVTPYGSDVIHERVPMGLLNESLVISDTNAWWDEHFGDIPGLKRFTWGQSLDDQLQPVLRSPLAVMEAEAPTGRVRAQAHFTGYNISQKILDCVRRIDPERVPLPHSSSSAA